MTPSRFRWGMLLVQIGVLLTLQNFGVLNENLWSELLLFFPLILIAVGVEKIFTKSKLQFISYLTTVALFFGGLAIAFNASAGHQAGSFFTDYTYDLEADDDVESLQVLLRLDGNDLTVRDATDELVNARFGEFTHKPEIDYELVDGVGMIEMSSRTTSSIGGIIRVSDNSPQDWRLRFSRTIPLELECIGDDADIHLNLFTTPVKKVIIIADDTKIYLKLGRLESEVTVYIEGDDSKLLLRLPNDMGVHLTGELEQFADDLAEFGMVEADGGYTNVGFADFDQKVAIELEQELKSLSIDFF